MLFRILVVFLLLGVYAVHGFTCGFNSSWVAEDELEQDRTAERRNSIYNWPRRNGKVEVAYYFTKTEGLGFLMKDAMQTVANIASCIRFKKERKNRGKKQLMIKVDKAKNKKSAYVTRPKGGQVHFHLVMEWYPTSRDYDEWKQYFVHELYHIFGFVHTFSRTDRNKYIKLHKDVLKRHGIEDQFTICTNCKKRGPYECSSIMHYNPHLSETESMFHSVSSECTKFFRWPTCNDEKSLQIKVCGRARGWCK